MRTRTVVDKLEKSPKYIQDPDMLWNLAQVLDVDPRVLFLHNEPGILEIFDIRQP